MPETNHNSVSDEQALAKLLEAAYVLQEHNRELQALAQRVEPPGPPAQPAQSVSTPADKASAASQPAPVAPDDYTLTLAQIVDAQHQIQARHLDLDSAMALVAERLSEIARAGGAAIGLLGNGKIRYKAAFGAMTLPVGAEVAAEKALCAACWQSGQVIRCEDVDHEFLFDPAECQRRGIQSMIAVPVYQVGGIGGGLELYYRSKRAFTEHDVHTCQLMAGLITEVLVRGDEVAGKKPLTSERSIMPDALQKLRPNLAVVADGSAGKDSDHVTGAARAAVTPAFLCRKCGHELVGEEQFCGNCGSPRSAGYGAPPMPSKVASLWPMQETARKTVSSGPANGASARQAILNHGQVGQARADLPEGEMPHLFSAPGLRIKETTPCSDSSALAKAEIEETSLPIVIANPEADAGQGSLSADGTRAKTDLAADWSSAAAARVFLDQLAAQRPHAWIRFWNARRGDIYLAIAVILVVCAIRWGIGSSHSVNATGNPEAATAPHRNPAPDADLSLFDRMLVNLGLAEAPEPPEYRGNPDTQVWVDLQTALYYCPGADLYGKTAKGKLTTQRDAQLDRFEPAYREACK